MIGEIIRTIFVLIVFGCSIIPSFYLYEKYLKNSKKVGEAKAKDYIKTWIGIAIIVTLPVILTITILNALDPSGGLVGLFGTFTDPDNYGAM